MTISYLSLAETANRAETLQRQDAAKHLFLMGPIVFLYYKESLVSSNLNSNLIKFHCAHPTVYILVVLHLDIVMKKIQSRNHSITLEILISVNLDIFII